MPSHVCHTDDEIFDVDREAELQVEYIACWGSCHSYLVFRL